MYDYYWPGYEDSAPLGHNTVCLLTEVASVNVATPITVAPDDLRAGQKGLPEYKPQINFPDPWPGGAWTLRDIVDYDLSAVRGLLRAVSAYREPIVQNFYDMGARAIEAGTRGGRSRSSSRPSSTILRRPRKLEELLLQGGIEIHRALEPFRADGDPYPAGTRHHPAGAAVSRVREDAARAAELPGAPRRRPAARPSAPYDVTGWTLPRRWASTSGRSSHRSSRRRCRA